MNSACIVNFNDILTPLYSTFVERELPDLASKDPAKKPDCLFIWTDFDQTMKMICVSALQNGVIPFMVQHGRRAMRDYFLPIAEPTALCAFVWGEQDRRDAIQGGWHQTRIFRVGAPWFAFRPERQEERGLVVFDVPHWSVDVPEAKRVWNKLRDIPGIRPIAKLVFPSQQKQENYEGEQFLTYRGEPGHLEATYSLISKASAVVCMMNGTLELMAHSLGVPVIHVSGFKHRELKGTWQGEEDVVAANGMYATDTDHLAKALTDVFKNPGIRAKEARADLLSEAGDPDKDTPVQSITIIASELIKKYKASGHAPVNFLDAKTPSIS